MIITTTEFGAFRVVGEDGIPRGMMILRSEEATTVVGMDDGPSLRAYRDDRDQGDEDRGDSDAPSSAMTRMMVGLRPHRIVVTYDDPAAPVMVKVHGRPDVSALARGAAVMRSLREPPTRR